MYINGKHDTNVDLSHYTLITWLSGWDAQGGCARAQHMMSTCFPFGYSIAQSQRWMARKRWSRPTWTRL